MYFQETKCLLVREFKSKHHTAANIRAFLEEALIGAGLPKAAVFRIVHDAASNMIAGMGTCDLNSILCVAHQLQRCIVGSMGKGAALSEILKRAKVGSASQRNVQCVWSCGDKV